MTTWPMAELLPHSGEMILLDSVLVGEGERILCRHTVRAGGLFNDSDGRLPAWCGVELMAQSVAAWSGWQGKQEQRPVRLGFLLGTRHYLCNVDAFVPGSELTVEAFRSFHDDNGMAMFACRIDAPGIQATARLTVFSPPDSDAFLASFAQSQPHV
jgi:predicted hotdog family 3-hydroxylacyl-ACP dehydratase